MKSKKIIVLILFLLIFCSTFFLTYICGPLWGDEIWIFGFCRNILDGLVIYRDYNVVTTPLYYFIGSFFIYIFGDHFISLGILNALLVSLIITLMYRVIKMKALIAWPLILFFFPNGYNLLSLFWLMLILFLIAKHKENNLLFGLILGLAFITKQNIGFCLLIPYLYYSKHKLKSIAFFGIPFAIISVYLLIEGAFMQFIDYCFLGLFEFGTNNQHIGIFLISELLVLFYLIIVLWKSKFANQEVFYILMFQIMTYPLFDGYHFFVSLFPVVYYILKINKNFCFTIALTFGIYYFTACCFSLINYDIHREKDLFYLRNCGSFPILMEDFHEYLKGIEYYYSPEAVMYLYKLYYNIPITVYDLWNEGNQGYHGIDKRIQEVDKICRKEKCIFVVGSDVVADEKFQGRKFYHYIIENYHKSDEFDTFIIYSNSLE